MAKPVGVGHLHAGSAAMVSKQGAQSRRSHTGAASGAFEGNKQSVGRSLRPFQPQIVVKEFGCFRGQRQEAGLVAFAAHADLRFRQQQDRPDSDPGLLASEAPAAASIPRWPGPVSSESWTRIAPLRPRTKARWFVWQSSRAIGSRRAAVCRCPWALAASRSTGSAGAICQGASGKAMRKARSTMATRWLMVAPVNSRSWLDWNRT